MKIWLYTLAASLLLPLLAGLFIALWPLAFIILAYLTLSPVIKGLYKLYTNIPNLLKALKK